MLQLEDGAPALGTPRKRKVNPLPFGRHLDLDHLLEHLDTALDLCGLGRLIAEPVDEHLDASHFLVLLAFGLAQTLEHRVALLDVFAVVTDVVCERAQVEIRNTRDHGIQKIPIVRNENYGVRIPAEIFLEPVARLQVEVIGWLVEEQQIRPAEEQLGQRNPHLPTA